MIEHLDALMFLAALAVLLSGYPVAFCLAGVALIFAFVGWWFGVFEPGYLVAAPQRIYGVMTNKVLIAVPLFVFMGVTLEKSKIAEELLDTMGKLFGSLRGGLGISVVLVGALLAASTGIVGATVVTMGLLSLPTMLKRGYDPALATGAICASGTLGQIIPPSIVLVLLGDAIGSSFQAAQRQMGSFSPKTVSVGDLFAGSLLPGLLLVAAYVGYVIFVAVTRPEHAPATAAEDRKGATVGGVLHALVAPLVLIIAVLGSILGGIATPTEAAAIGAVGALFLAAIRRTDERPSGKASVTLTYVGAAAILGLVALTSIADLRLGRDALSGLDRAGLAAAFALCAVAALGVFAALFRLWPSRIVHDVTRDTANITAMVFVILIGATLFSLVFRGLGGDQLVENLLRSSSAGLVDLIEGALRMVGLSDAATAFGESDAAVAGVGVTIVMAVMFLLGFFLDFIEITFVVVPLVAPPLMALGIDPVWLGVMMAVNLQTSFLTPPFGFALFYLRGVAPPSVTTGQIYRGAVPFVMIQIAGLIAVALFPALATWLPSVMFK